MKHNNQCHPNLSFARLFNYIYICCVLVVVKVLEAHISANKTKTCCMATNCERRNYVFCCWFFQFGWIEPLNVCSNILLILSLTLWALWNQTLFCIFSDIQPFCLSSTWNLLHMNFFPPAQLNLQHVKS